jgi:hypothetical protein
MEVHRKTLKPETFTYPLQPMDQDAPESKFQLARDRDAYATIRGFFFQAERTVQRWIQLETGQVLQLEFGEDIDILSRALVDNDWQEERVLEQLKSWEKPITLVSSREALANFHEHRATNPGLNLRFCLTTNAKIGLEKSPLFKRDKKPGIEWWRDLAKGERNDSDRRFVAHPAVFRQVWSARKVQ